MIEHEPMFVLPVGWRVAGGTCQVHSVRGYEHEHGQILVVGSRSPLPRRRCVRALLAPCIRAWKWIGPDWPPREAWSMGTSASTENRSMGHEA
jgi:hypothetical protein